MTDTLTLSNRRLSFLLPAFLPALALGLTVLATTLFAFMQTDDFCTFGRVGASNGNPLPDIATLYMQWTGRYSSIVATTFVAAVSHFIPLEALYPFTLLSCALAFFLACVCVSRLVDGEMRRNLPWAISAFGTIMLLMPSKLEQYLWLTGALVYFLGASLFFVLMLKVARAQTGPSSRREEAWIAILIVMVVGFNEFIALMVAACLAWPAFAAVRARAPVRTHVVRLAIFTAAFAATVLAPGNFARDSASELIRHDMGAALSMGWDSLRLYFARFTTSPVEPVATLLAGAAAGMLMVPPSRSSRISQWLPWVVVLLLAVPAHFVLYPFLVGEPAPGRVLNQVFMFIAVALLITSGRAGAAVSQRIGRRSVLVGCVTFAAAGIALLGTPSYRTMLNTTLEFAPAWRTQQLERHAGLEALRGTQQPVYVRPFPSSEATPPLYTGGDVGPNPDYWVNQCAAGYYGVDSIIQMRRGK